MFDLEPRYAGESYPVPDVSTRDLRYYSIEQKYPRIALALHAFLVHQALTQCACRAMQHSAWPMW